MSYKTITIKVDADKLKRMREFYTSCMQENDGEYVFFQAYSNEIIITGYLSKKEPYKVTFTGTNPLTEALIWDENAAYKESKASVKEEWICFDDQIGSDEVGVGDFLLPMIVVAAFVKKSDIKILKKLGVQDSKKLTDEKIMAMGPELVKMFKFSKLTLSNEKYNEMYLKNENINSLKAKMHNRALLNMHKEYPDVINIFVDQFVKPDTYYEYLDDDKEEQVKDICFKTKGESWFPCVALASVIARYSFLLEQEKISKELGINVHFGAGSKANECAKWILEHKGLSTLEKYAKKNFANFREVIESK